MRNVAERIARLSATLSRMLTLTLSLLLPLCTGAVDSLIHWSDPQPPPPPVEGAPAPAGSVALEEDVFRVHEKVSVKLTYTAGEELFPGDIIRVEEPIFHGMRWAKWGYLSTNAGQCSPLSEVEEASAGFVTATTNSGAQLSVVHSTNNSDIHAYGTVDVEIVSGGVAPGETVTFSLGVTDNDCGWQTANRAFTDVPIRAFELIGGADVEPVLVSPSPLFSFVAEEEVALVEAILPSTAAVGEVVALRVAELDRWGNVAGEGEVTLEEVSFDAPGIHRVEITRGDITATSNPILVTEVAPAFGIYWGDLHTHHGHSYTDDSGDWINENHAYARDVMGLDYASESVKAPPHELDHEALWEAQQRACREYTDGAYVALLGFEWMGDAAQGHHNVYVDGCELEPGSATFRDVEEDLWTYMESAEAETGYNIVSVPHASSYTGFNWRVRDDRLRPVAEVYSEWSTSMDESQPGSVPDGLRSGNRMGLIAASDNHDGWLGNGLAKKDAPGGIGAILAEELTATGLLEAMQDRRTYATTGDRMLLQVELTDGDEVYPTGSELQPDEPRLRWIAGGTDTIERVDVWLTSIPSKDKSAVWASWSPDALDAEGEIALPWGHFPLVVWVEVTQVDGEKAWSSPFWIEPPELAEPSGCGSKGEGDTAALLLLPLVLIGRRRRRRA